MAEYWYNLVTGEVEDGPQSLGTDRVGPFPTRQDAARALQTLRARAAQWAAEDAHEDDWPKKRYSGRPEGAEGAPEG